ncbi:endolytic transglycosylase MltG [soil metagenome]
MTDTSSKVKPASQPRPTGHRRFVGILLFGTAVLLVAAFFTVRTQLGPVATASTPTEFEVLPGWGGKRVAQALADAGLVRDARVFGLYLRYRDLDRAIGEGLYDLDPALSAAEVADKLSEGGRPRTVFVVIPEGFRLVDIAARLEKLGFGDKAAFLALFTEPGELRPDYVPAGSSLEGYLFPAGYELPVRSEPETIVRTMLARFEKERDKYADALAARDLPVNTWVTLASMVQAEAADATEMPIIAGVFLNRLERDMLLQSDPTVAYGLGKDLPRLDAVAGDLKQDTPWNTYTRAGLPATPIANPGEDALAAVLEPVRQNADGQDYLYFLHGSDGGETVFRPNLDLAAHEADVERYLRTP